MMRLASLLRLGVLLMVAVTAAAQEAPLLTVLPRQEQVRQLELRADLHMIRKHYLEAIDFYQEALRWAPRNSVLLNKTGIAFQQLSELKDAKKYYKRATKADKSYAAAWNNLGTVYYAQKNYKKAIRYYRRALKRSPVQGDIHLNLGTALFARKKYDQAVEEFRLALLLDPEVFRRRGLFGTLIQSRSVQDRARYYFMVAKSLASLGYVDRCVAYLRRALEDGFPSIEAQGDPAFVLVREDKRFQALFAEKPPGIEP
ncbi:MAG: tetratricopeptide repeat protein [Terriglobia bacterium]